MARDMRNDNSPADVIKSIREARKKGEYPGGKMVSMEIIKPDLTEDDEQSHVLDNAQLCDILAYTIAIRPELEGINPGR